MSPKLPRLLKACFSGERSPEKLHHKVDGYLSKMARECLDESSNRSDHNNNDNNADALGNPKSCERPKSKTSKTPKSSKTSSRAAEKPKSSKTLETSKSTKTSSKTSSSSVRIPTPFKMTRPSKPAKKSSKEVASNVETVAQPASAKKPSKLPIRTCGEALSNKEKLKEFVAQLTIVLNDMDAEVAENMPPIAKMSTDLYHKLLVNRSDDYNLWWHVISTKYVSAHSADETRSMFIDALSIVPPELDRPGIGCYGPRYLDWLAYVRLWLHYIDWSIGFDINEAEQIVSLFQLSYANKFYDSRIFLLIGKYVTSVRVMIPAIWRRGNAYCSASHDLYEFYTKFYLRKITTHHDVFKVVAYVQQYIYFNPNSSRVRSFCFGLARKWMYNQVTSLAKGIMLAVRKCQARLVHPELYSLEYLRFCLEVGDYTQAYRYYDSLTRSLPGDPDYVDYSFGDDPQFGRIYLDIIGGLMDFVSWTTPAAAAEAADRE